MAQKLKKLILALAFLFIASGTSLVPTSVFAANVSGTGAGGGSTNCNDPGLTAAQKKSCQACESGAKKCLEKNVIIDRLNDVINVLIGLVAVVVIAMVITGGIQYSMAGGSPEKTSAAKKRITNALLAMFAFLLIWGFLQWLLPGGI